MPRYVFIIANSFPYPLDENTLYHPVRALRYVGETLANAGYRGSLTGHTPHNGNDLTGSTWEFSSPLGIDAGTRRKLEVYPGVTLKEL